MKIEPLHDKILVTKLYVEKIGSIFLPEEAVPESQEGIVEAVGPKTRQVKVGDKIFFPKYVGLNFTIKGKKYYMIDESQVLTIIDAK